MAVHNAIEQGEKNDMNPTVMGSGAANERTGTLGLTCLLVCLGKYYRVHSPGRYRLHSLVPPVFALAPQHMAPLPHVQAGVAPLPHVRAGVALPHLRAGVAPLPHVRAGA